MDKVKRNNAVRIIFRPTTMSMVLHWIVLILVLISFIAVTLIVDRSRGYFNDAILFPIVIIFIVMFALFASRVHTILTPKQYLTLNSDMVSIHKSDKMQIEISWPRVEEIIFVFDGAKIYMIIELTNMKPLKFELCGWWVYSEFNSSKGLKNNYNKIMSLYGSVFEFRNKINAQYHLKIFNEYNIDPPEWLKVTSNK